MRNFLGILTSIIILVSCNTRRSTDGNNSKEPYYSKKIKYKIDSYQIEGQALTSTVEGGMPYGRIVFIDDSNFFANVAIDKPFSCKFISIDDSCIYGTSFVSNNKKIRFHISAIVDVNNDQ